jgi:signal transduction histidine kinase
LSLGLILPALLAFGLFRRQARPFAGALVLTATFLVLYVGIVISTGGIKSPMLGSIAILFLTFLGVREGRAAQGVLIFAGVFLLGIFVMDSMGYPLPNKVNPRWASFVYLNWTLALMFQLYGINRIFLENYDSNILQLKQAQETLVRQEKMASLGQMTAGIAHELNNPLNVVQGNASVLQLNLGELLPVLHALRNKDGSAGDTDLKAQIEALELEMMIPELEESLQSLNRGCQRMQHIVSGLSTFAHTAPDQHHPTDLAGLLESALTILAHKIREHQVRVERDLAPLPPLFCDSGKLSQVFLNLLDNALEAMPEGGTLSVRLNSVEGMYQVEVQDDGVGMDAETQGHLFEPFFTTRAIGEGTGLGLALSYGIVAQHGGDIEVESALGEGSTFRVRLVPPPAPASGG